VKLLAEGAWYSARWKVRASSTLALPIDIALYVARAGGDHGYWSNVSLPLRDTWGGAYFAYSSLPALVHVLVGERTLRAIAAHDRPDPVDPADENASSVTERQATVAVHIRARIIETLSAVDSGNERVIDEHLAIHAAFAADQDAFVTRWRDVAESLGGMLASTWPPVLTVAREYGLVSVALHWSTSERRGASAYLELAVDARQSPTWTMERSQSAVPASVVIGGAMFLVTGDAPADLETLAPFVLGTDPVSITVRRNTVVRVASHDPDTALFEKLLALPALLCGRGDPYR